MTGTTGDVLVVLLLPFGSFTPDQPAVDITVNATMSEDADSGTALAISARGGFYFGTDALDNPLTDPSVLTVSDPDPANWGSPTLVTPTLIELTATYSGAEDETATGPNYVNQYTIDIDIADDQTITDLDITSLLPNNIVVTSVPVVSFLGGATGTVNTISPVAVPYGPFNAPSNESIVNLSTVTAGVAGASDVRVTFDFYVNEFDADGMTIMPPKI